MDCIHNFRDFGGYQTENGAYIKKGLLYRSGALDKATDADLEKLSALGIKTICDLRSERERRMEPDRIPDLKPVTENRVIQVIATQKFFRKVYLADPHNNTRNPPGKKIPKRNPNTRIDDRYVEHGVKSFPHCSQDKGNTSRVWQQ